MDDIGILYFFCNRCCKNNFFTLQANVFYQSWFLPFGGSAYKTFPANLALPVHDAAVFVVGFMGFQAENFYRTTRLFYKSDPCIDHFAVVKYQQAFGWNMIGDVSVNIFADIAIPVDQQPGGIALWQWMQGNLFFR